jgi:hypothetical protein
MATGDASNFLISIINCVSSFFVTSRIFLGFENDSMHAVDWPGAFVLSREKLFAADGTSHDVADKWIALWQISCEVHLLPTSSQMLVKKLL